MMKKKACTHTLSLFISTSSFLHLFCFCSIQFDSLASVGVGGVLGIVALFLIHRNVSALSGRTIPADELHKITETLKRDESIKEIGAVKAISMGVGMSRFSADGK
jgi:divalent metal cation (Fe/Co/Zn/Cd) transporter